MDRFLFGGRGLSSVFHVSLILSLSLSRSVSPTLLPLSLPTQCRRNSIGALQVHPFFIWRLTTPASSSLDWDPVLSQKKKKRKSVATRKRGGVGGSRRRHRDGGRKVGGNSSVGGECVYASVCRREKREMEREMENRRRG